MFYSGFLDLSWIGLEDECAKRECPLNILNMKDVEEIMLMNFIRLQKIPHFPSFLIKPFRD